MEDDAQVMALNRQAFEQEGYVVLTAETLNSARLLFDRESPDVIVLDMPSRRAVFEGRDIVLTPKEFGLLEALTRRVGQYVGAYELYQSVWGLNAHEDIRTLFVRR